ncbi:6dcb3be8-b1ad-4d1b-a7d1-e20cabd9a2fd [Thermothielavioides terrestris]|uniref:6dcb3be8-b1ad-4d1b-a7d1-e20cabd9a2fd n=1 Tax=Thermothielavioides terrestris TaxID=2587410 RepID=A0A446BPK5_9PEZI|nr:6dcb3be8-b1ad-4d1b-a7d1-e20cabd9a2fd [Thermothielavioides terrestris]
MAAGRLQTREDYSDFRSSIRRHNNASQFSLSWQACAETWELAAKVLGGSNREWQQAVARDLADDELGGLSFVARTVRLCTSLPSDENCLGVARSFFQAITHSSFLRCLSIDSFVGTIYRVIGGSNGDQGIAFFGNLNKRLIPTTQASSTFLALMVLTLYELLRRERKCLLNDDLTALLGALDDKATQIREGNTGDLGVAASLDTARAHIDMIRRMADAARGCLANDDPADITAPRSASNILSTFPMEVIVPGGKHDNDFADVTTIQIFPTFGEITSEVSDYLPVTDFTQPHFLADPVQRHLDSAFRLLRHDIFGPLKEVIGFVLAQPDVPHAASLSRFIGGNIRAHSYSRARIQHVFIDRGLEAIVSFSEPPQLRKHSLGDRRRWWQQSSRLEPGSLICWVSARGDEKSFLLFVVSQKNTEDVPEGKNESTLVSEHFNPSVTVRLASESLPNLSVLSQLYVRKQEGLLIQLPGLIPETFVPILENLQQMMRDGNLAFRQWILPGPSGGQASTQVPAPAYARRAGFRFRLNSIIRTPGDADLCLDPTNPNDSVSPEALETATGLDRGQAEGLIAGLSCEYALIQGPPGTGKSYLGVQLVRVLLDHKAEADLGPILVICYTNHALDQFLKHLMQVGIDKIIRIGGQSRSEELDGKNLKVVSRDAPKTRLENQILAQGYSESKKCLETAGNRLKPLHQVRKAHPSWNSLQTFLRRRLPRIAVQFEARDSKEFIVVGRDPLKVWLGKKNPNHEGADSTIDMEELRLRAEQSIHSLTHPERWVLAESWVDQLVQEQTDGIFELLDGAKRCRENLRDVHDDVSRRTLLQADVVGVTTTGLARNIKMLRRLGSKVIICEEAAEVMEPHLISALMPGVEHFIQIGDHKQLRPQIQNYLQFSLETPAGRAYQLDRSQFERRAVGEPGLPPLPVAQLKVQRRMRPEISQLIRRVYPNLEDHGCVKDLPSVIGMRDNLFWLDHSHPEDGKEDDAHLKSHSNPWEVAMSVALVRHLVRQGEYNSTDIALLTPYTGQLQKLRAALSQDFEVFLSDRDMEKLAMEGFEADLGEEAKPASGPAKAVEKKQLLKTIRLATVDNFQGEEAKVIVVSLVRSNSNCKVGFLRTENRINVLLSRAQHGMYLIGNAKTYQNVPMWAEVLQQLIERNAVGTSIALTCPRHPETPILCSEPGDFAAKSPEVCCTRKDARVDLMEFKTYGEIDLDETPIAVLGCGHFFTGETLDGHVGMGNVYTSDRSGRYNGLQELSGALTAIPACPDCRVPIRQFATRRYNRVVNKAVLDETSKRLLLAGRHRLDELERRVTDIEKELSESRDAVITAHPDRRDPTPGRYKDAISLMKETAKLRREMDTEHQPTKKLLDAIKTFQRLARERTSLDQNLQALNLSGANNTSVAGSAILQPVYDQQITLGAHRLELRIWEAVLRDSFTLLSKRSGPLVTPDIPGGPLDQQSASFLKQCKVLIYRATEAKLPRLVIQTALSFARIAQLDGWYRRATSTAAAAAAAVANPTAPPPANPPAKQAGNSSSSGSSSDEPADTTDTARKLLAAALDLCASLPGSDGEAYRAEMEETMRLFDGPRYETVSPEEIAAIKSAMVAGPAGMATHAGHWYTCRNGHSFAIGECGMPMERARCPECGEVIGGEDHMLAEGVQRDLRMEMA